MESHPKTLEWGKKAARIGIYTVCAAVINYLLFLWLVFWFDDIMPTNPPASPYENAFSFVCTVALWPFVVVELFLGRDPPQAWWPLLWVLSGVSWGSGIEWVRNSASRMRAKASNAPVQCFQKWVVVQVCIWTVGCGLWFYLRASRILAHPSDPENYGKFGHNWGFQTQAFILSRLIPLAFGLLTLIVVEWYVRLLTLARKGLRNET